MGHLFLLIVIVFGFDKLLATQSSDIDPALVNYYVELINNRTQQALEYELPTDARMYKPTNNTIEGTYFQYKMVLRF